MKTSFLSWFNNIAPEKKVTTLLLIYIMITSPILVKQYNMINTLKDLVNTISVRYERQINVINENNAKDAKIEFKRRDSIAQARADLKEQEFRDLINERTMKIKKATKLIQNTTQ